MSSPYNQVRISQLFAHWSDLTGLDTEGKSVDFERNFKIWYFFFGNAPQRLLGVFGWRSGGSRLGLVVFQGLERKNAL